MASLATDISHRRRLTSEYGVATPANWVRGQDVILSPSTTEEEARKLFPQGWREHNHYIRMVADPAH